MSYDHADQWADARNPQPLYAWEPDAIDHLAVVLSDVPLATQLLKIQEEAGEVAAAYIGWMGHNPAKGRHKTEEDLVTELLDVAVTALVAYTMMTRGRIATRGSQAVTALRERAEQKMNDLQHPQPKEHDAPPHR